MVQKKFARTLYFYMEDPNSSFYYAHKLLKVKVFTDIYTHASCFKVTIYERTHPVVNNSRYALYVVVNYNPIKPPPLKLKSLYPLLWPVQTSNPNPVHR